MDELYTFGTLLRRQRKALDLTQDALARLAGCAFGTIQKLEADERRPSREMAERLANVLQITPAERERFLKSARSGIAEDDLPSTAVSVATGRTGTSPASQTDRLLAQPGSDLPDGTITFLLTDVEGSTALWEQDAGAMRQALQRHDALIEATVRQHGGQIVRPRGEGDSCFAVCARARDAVLAAVVLQQAFSAEAWPTPMPLRVRIALHTGDAYLQDGDYYGSAVNRCARLRAVAHGGQTLVSLATQELVRDQMLPGIELRDLGRHRLKDLHRLEHIFQLVSADLAADFPPLKTLDTHPNNLPLQPTPFIGREREVTMVCQYLMQPVVHLLTLTGVGGTGKTRLALQVAAEVSDEFADGVWFVNLALLSDPGLVIASIASTLGTKAIGSQLLVEVLQVYLRDKQLLLVLDNFEQVLPAAPQVASLLAAAPHVKVVVTSRAVLHLRGEREVIVPPLMLPDLQHLPALEQLTQYEAVRLFIARAQDVRADFQVTNATAPAIAEICYRLDGLPLAIELAAARTRLLTPQALLARLGSRLTLLTGGARDLPPRQQTIRATIEWSYQLLTAEEQALFACLAVFLGGCTLEAAEAVCIGSDDHPIEVLDGLQSLVDNSLLQQEEITGGTPRFMMLETIREYARERLLSDPALVSCYERHVTYFRSMMEAARKSSRTDFNSVWMDRFAQEQENCRAALRWAIDHDRVELAAQLLDPLWDFWIERGQATEGRWWVDKVLASGSPLPPMVHASMLNIGANLAGSQSDWGHSWSLREASLAWYRELGDQDGIARILHNLGIEATVHGDIAAGIRYLEEGLAIRRNLGDQSKLAYHLNTMGLIAGRVEEYQRARGFLDESRALYHEIGDQSGVVMVLHNLALLTKDQGAFAAATEYLEEALALTKQYGSRTEIGLVLVTMGDIALAQEPYEPERTTSFLEEALIFLQEEEGIVSALALRTLGRAVARQGAYQRAHDLFAEYFARVQAWGYRAEVLDGLEDMTGVIVSGGEAERAVRVLGATAALRAALDMPLSAGQRHSYDQSVAAARALLGEANWEAAWAEGQAMTVEQVIAYALETLPLTDQPATAEEGVNCTPLSRQQNRSDGLAPWYS